ncbi:MAG: hypothetical protein D6797_05510 [Bdellovibrio sp.]|nr:MAG: hypothetical protein D6797_05510 [Bdellovibrio sp.]
MGLRFQTKPQSQPQDIILHVRMLDRLRLMQQEALGVLGVNLLFAAFYLVDLETEFVASLVENIGFDRLEIDFLKFSGDALKHIDNNRLSLELVRQGLTKSVMFSPEGEALLAADTLYGKPVVVQKGTFRPIINTNVQILEKGLEQVQKVTSKAPLVCFEVSISKFYEKESGVAEEQWDVPDILARVQTIGALGYHVMVSKYALYSSLKKHLRRCTSEEIIFFIGADSLDKLLDSQVYEEYPGGLLGAMGQLFDKNTRVYVYPYKTKALCLTAKTFSPSPQQQSLYRYFLENHYLEDILGCDEVDSSIRSDDVRDMLAQGNKEWEKHVPEPVCQLIKEKKFFGYKEK